MIAIDMTTVTVVTKAIVAGLTMDLAIVVITKPIMDLLHGVVIMMTNNISDNEQSLFNRSVQIVDVAHKLF
jgi:hypothetical protein